MEIINKEKILKLNTYIKTNIKDKKFKYITFFWLIISTQFIIGNNLQTKGYSLKNSGDLAINLIKIILLSTLCIIINYYFLELYNKISKKQKTLNIQNDKFKKYRGLIYFSIIILCWIPTLLAFYPSIVSYDGGYQIRDYVFERKINLGHPIITTFLYTTFFLFGFSHFNSPTIGMLIFSIFQMILMALIFSYAVKFIEDETGKKYLRNISILFYGLFPYNQLFSIMTTKDVIFAGIVVLFVINLYKILTKDDNIVEYISFIGITILMLLFRNNAVYALIVLIPVSIVLLINNKKILKKMVCAILISIILYESFNSIILNIVAPQGVGNNDIWLCTFAQAVGKIVNEENENLTESEKEKISFYFTDYEKIGNAYIQYIADSTMKLIQLDNINGNKKDFFKLMFELSKKYPRKFMDSYLNTMRGYWYVLDDSFCRIRKKTYKDKMGALELYCFPVGTDKYKIKEESKLPKLKQFYIDMFCKNEFLKIPVLRIAFQPATYFYVLIAYLLYVIYKKYKVRTIIGIYLFLYFLTCFLAPCAIIRYIYAVIVCVPLIWSFVIKD